MVISISRSWYVYSGMCNMCRGVITKATSGIVDVCRKTFRDAEPNCLKGEDVCVCVCVRVCVCVWFPIKGGGVVNHAIPIA
jgi:hypothetical protein